jgi:hypothetical protein
MTKILVIPDLHLKTRVLDQAEKILTGDPNLKAVLLGDYLDDFYATQPDYDEFITRLLKFKADFPESVFLWGNHEIAYVLRRPVTGDTRWGENVVTIVKKEIRPKIAHNEGKVIFSHAGIFNEWLGAQGISSDEDPEAIVELINKMPCEEFWQDNSPIWARPQHENYHIAGRWLDYKQVVGHTPMQKITDDGNVVSADVFSTNWGKKHGEEKFIIINTETGEWVRS